MPGRVARRVRRLKGATPLNIIMPLSAMVIGWALAIAILTHYAAAPLRRTHELVWGLAFLMFGLGAFAGVIGAAAGWNEIMARVYYVSGAILAVAFLGIGELVLLARGGMLGRVGMWAGAALTLITVIALATSPFDPAMLNSNTPWRAVAPSGSLPVALAALSNIAGTLLIVGGTLYSAWIFWRQHIQKQRMVGCILLAVGTMVVASGGELAARFSQPSWLYPPMAVGVAIMFVGYLQTTRAGAPARAGGPAQQLATTKK